MALSGRFVPLVVLSVAALIAPLPGCDDSSPRAQQTNGIVRIGSFSADDALALSDKLRARGVHDDIVYLLRFVHYYKLGQRDPALVALELVNEQAAKAVVASARERRALEDQGATTDLQEGLDLRSEMEAKPVSDCEAEVSSGRFTPLTGKQFCPLWDSGILDLLPTPGELITVSGRLLARQALLRLPRERMRTIPRLASIMAKTEARRVLLRQQVTQHIAVEDELIKQLLDFQWNVTVDLSDRGH